MTAAKRLVLPYSVRYSATPMPIGTAIAVASATISIVPEDRALDRRPGSPRKLPVGSVVKKSLLQASVALMNR